MLFTGFFAKAVCYFMLFSAVFGVFWGPVRRCCRAALIFTPSPDQLEHPWICLYQLPQGGTGFQPVSFLFPKTFSRERGNPQTTTSLVNNCPCHQSNPSDSFKRWISLD
jgi:hypothetical protein